MISNFIPNALALGLIAATTAQMSAAPAAPSPAAAPAKPAAAAAPAVPEAPAKPALDPAVVKTDSSYALGFRTGGSFSQQFGRFGVSVGDLDTESFLKGFMAAFKGEKPGLDEEKLQAAMQALGDLLQGREKESAAANLEKGKKFLDENAKRTGVVTTKSGLQYEVLAKGGEEKYAAPKEGATDSKEFLVNYKGTLIDGKEFDASPAGKPVPMTLQVVPGFKEALTTMPVGAKWKLFIPSALAYGEERKSAALAPNSVLIFELELVKIQDAPPQQPFQMPGGPGGAPGGPEGPGGPGGPGGPEGE
ncbi:MAG: FKBP-type peptidyl-prolyl cis-trans isomerase [Verrucomicrobia bacterium]|nr:MAG: FKBP-type peptidyl-prolyl cis-trans isomerase [Verrucomicrobiota bacterium]